MKYLSLRGFPLLVVQIFICATVLLGQRIQITDYKQINLQDGLKNTEIDKIVRGPKGFFYLFSPTDIQKWDGLDFVDLHAGRDIRFKSYLQQFRSAELVSNRHILVTSEQSDSLYYLIDTYTDQYVSYNLGSTYHVIDYSKYLIVQQGNKIFKVEDIFNPHPELIFTMTSSAKVDDIVYVDEHWFYSQNKNIFSVGSNGPILRQDISGRIFLWQGELLSIKDRQITIDRDNKSHSLYTIPENYPSGTHLSLPSEDSKGNLLFMVYDSNGLSRDYLLINKDLSVVPLPAKFRLYASRGISAYAEDFMQKMLIGTHNGLVYFAMAKPGLENYVAFDSLPPGGYGNIVTDLIDDGDYVMGVCEREILFRFNKMTSTVDCPFQPYFKNRPMSDITPDYIRSQLKISYHKSNNRIVKNPNNKEYFTLSYIFYEDSSYLYSFQNFDAPPKTYPKIHNSYTGFRYWKDDLTLLGGRKESDKGVLSIFNMSDKRTQEVFSADPRVPPINSIFVDTLDHSFWLATTSGPVHLSSDLKFQEIKEISSDAYEWLLRSDVRDINKVGGKIYFSTKLGFFVLDLTDERLTHLTEYHGLTNTLCYTSEVDQDGNVWVGTHSGLTVLDPDLNVIRVYYDQDGLGLHNNEFNTASSISASDGNLYFGTVNGMVRVIPRLLLESSYSNGFQINKLYYKKGGKEYLYSDSIGTNLELPWGTDSLYFEVSYPDYFGYSSQHIQHRGVNYTTSLPVKISHDKSSVSLSDLDNQDLKLYIHSDSVQPREMSITFHHNYVNLIVYLVSIILIILIAIYLSRRAIKNNKLKQIEEVKMQNRINSLQLSTLQAQMNPHFIFNVLGSIQYFIETGHHDEAGNYLSDFGNLMRKFLEASRSELISLSDEIELLKLYLEMEQIRFDSKFDMKIEVPDNLDTDLQIPPMILQPFVENSLKHGILNLKDKKGLIEIIFTQIDNYTVECLIRDNGIGREAAANVKSNGHVSRGMEIVKDKINLLRESDKMIIDIDILDLYDENNNPRGTEVKINFKEVE